jgi:hypothetical protein
MSCRVRRYYLHVFVDDKQALAHAGHRRFEQRTQS